MHQNSSFFTSLVTLLKNPSKSSSLAGISLVTALVALSLAPIFIKFSLTDMSPDATIFNRLWIATLVLLFWESLSNWQQEKSEKKVNEKSASWSFSQWQIILLVAFTSTASVACWAWSLTQTSVANSTVLRNLTPLFTSLGGWLFLKLKFERQFVVGMIIALFGAVAIGWDDFQVGTESIWGDGIALLSALLYAIYLFAVEHLRDRFNTTTILLWRCAFGSCLMFPVVFLTEETLLPHSLNGWLSVIALAIICQVFGQGLLIFSLKQFSSGLIAIFLLLQPAITSLLALVIFSESLTLFNCIAFAFVLLGIYIAQSNYSSVSN